LFVLLYQYFLIVELLCFAVFALELLLLHFALVLVLVPVELLQLALVLVFLVVELLLEQIVLER